MMPTFGAVPPYTPPYLSGGYYYAQGIGAAVAPVAGSSGAMYLHPFILPFPVLLDSLVAHVVAGAAGGNIQLAIYGSSPATLLPTGAAIYSGASLSIATSSTILEDTAPNVLLQPGVYWAASNKDTLGLTATLKVVSASPYSVAQMLPSSSAANLILASGSTSVFCGYSKTQTFGTWPTLTGNATTDSLTAIQANTIPAIAFKAG